MTQDELKALVGQAAIAYVQPGSIVGVGTGSTVNHFIEALAQMPVRVAGAVSSSVQSTERLKKHGIPVLEANEVTGLGVYVDGADEIDRARLHDQGRRRGADAREDRRRPRRRSSSASPTNPSACRCWAASRCRSR